MFHEPTTGRLLRHRPGHQDRPRDGHRVRHERAARRGQVRPGAGRPVPRPADGPPAGLLARGRPRDRRGGAQAHRGRAHRGVGDPEHLPRRPGRRWPRSSSSRRRCSARTSSGIFASVDKRPRITAFNDFGDRTPSDRPPIKTRREVAAERGEPWPPEDERREPARVGAGANGHGPSRTGWGSTGPGRTVPCRTARARPARTARPRAGVRRTPRRWARPPRAARGRTRPARAATRPVAARRAGAFRTSTARAGPPSRRPRCRRTTARRLGGPLRRRRAAPPGKAARAPTVSTARVSRAPASTAAAPARRSPGGAPRAGSTRPRRTAPPPDGGARPTASSQRRVVHVTRRRRSEPVR